MGYGTSVCPKCGYKPAMFMGPACPYCGALQYTAGGCLMWFVAFIVGIGILLACHGK